MQQITQQIIDKCIRLSGVEPASRIIACHPIVEPDLEEGWKTRFSELAFGDLVRYRRGGGEWSEYMIYGDRCNMGMAGWEVSLIPIPVGSTIFLMSMDDGELLELEYFGPLWPKSDCDFT